MEYKVIRKETKTGKIFETICSKEQVNNITKYPISLYTLESIEPITEQTYTYYFRLREPGIGCQPKNGLINLTYNSITHNSRNYWGSATYNRPLTSLETNNYDLELV